MKDEIDSLETVNKIEIKRPKLNKYVQCQKNSFKKSSMADEKNRLVTYRNWPLLMLNPKQLAKCGFYYTGVLDVVTCYCCNGSLGNWKTSDDPLTEHEKFFPHCEYMDLIRMKLNNKAECLLKNQILQETCKIFSTLKIQEVSASRNTGQRQDTGAENTIICKICMNEEMNVVFFNHVLISFLVIDF
ncbi:baculoviral IAP repeat-containing protein 2 [Trichonephila clavipes]|nr:baculoviral IAP repeat-containing protein 2 [Trichonephila clavipes]